MIVIAFLFSFLLYGCASIVTGQNQVVSIETSPHKEASCELQNDKGKWFISSTLGTVMINRSYDNLVVSCQKDEKKGNVYVKSSTKGMAFGNILVGGLIGTAVDCSTGAAYDYPSIITVALK
jgi:uncharacterized protein YceK